MPQDDLTPFIDPQNTYMHRCKGNKSILRWKKRPSIIEKRKTIFFQNQLLEFFVFDQNPTQTSCQEQKIMSEVDDLHIKPGVGRNPQCPLQWQRCFETDIFFHPAPKGKACFLKGASHSFGQNPFSILVDTPSMVRSIQKFAHLLYTHFLLFPVNLFCFS